VSYVNPQLDHAAIRSALQGRRRVLIRDFFRPEIAETLANALTQVDWSLVFRDANGDRRLSGDEMRAMTPVQRQELAIRIQQFAEQHYQFSFFSHAMVHTAQKGESDLLTRLVRYMADEEFMGIIRSLSGVPDINRVYAQGTLYARGSFLNVHTDETEVETRRLAYVINLTPVWRPDWGGLLQFDDGHGNVTDTFFPHFNSVSLFLVPQNHCVTFVPPYAQGGRYAITGWMIAA